MRQISRYIAYILIGFICLSVVMSIVLDVKTTHTNQCTYIEEIKDTMLLSHVELSSAMKYINDIPIVMLNEPNEDIQIEETTTVKETVTTESNMDNYTEVELDILYRIVEAEATGEDIKGKILIVNVIINRINDTRFPNDVESVVFQRKPVTQFSPISDKRYYTVEVTEDTKDAVYQAIELEKDYSQGALFFHSASINPRWRYKKLFQHGNHIFYGM